MARILEAGAAGTRGPRMHAFGDLKGASVAATDHDIGHVRDVLFDDRTWTVRYVVVDTSRWLHGRQVLLSPAAVASIDTDHHLRTRLTRAEVEASPPIDAHASVTRVHEARLSEYMGWAWPAYWAGPFRWGEVPTPGLSWTHRSAGDTRVDVADDDTHLQSMRGVSGYTLEAVDGPVGHVADFLFDEDTWAIHVVRVDPHRWWPGKDLLVPTDLIVAVDWLGKRIRVDTKRGDIRRSAA